MATTHRSGGGAAPWIAFAMALFFAALAIIGLIAVNDGVAPPAPSPSLSLLPPQLELPQIRPPGPIPPMPS